MPHLKSICVGHVWIGIRYLLFEKSDLMDYQRLLVYERNYVILLSRDNILET